MSNLPRIQADIGDVVTWVFVAVAVLFWIWLALRLGSAAVLKSYAIYRNRKQQTEQDPPR